MDSKYSVFINWNEKEWKFIAITDNYPVLTGFGTSRNYALNDLEKQVEMFKQ